MNIEAIVKELLLQSGSMGPVVTSHFTTLVLEASYPLPVFKLHLQSEEGNICLALMIAKTLARVHIKILSTTLQFFFIYSYIFCSFGCSNYSQHSTVRYFRRHVL